MIWDLLSKSDQHVKTDRSQDPTAFRLSLNENDLPDGEEAEPAKAARRVEATSKNPPGLEEHGPQPIFSRERVQSLAGAKRLV